MRPPIAAELLLFARVLMRLPRRLRGAAARSILSEVDVAARYLIQTGRRHPMFGDGSLMARCHALQPAAEPMADDPDFLRALRTVTAAMLRHSEM